MSENKKHSSTFNVLLVAVICGSFVFSSTKTSAKKKKKTSSVTTACIACLNSFDAETLEFTINKNKCPKQLAKCYKANYTNKCEGIIEDCIDYNCKTAGSCGDEAGNRNLFAGCLKAVNQILPYQCASYIAGYASSKAEEVKAKATAQTNALEQQKIAAQNAAAAAEKAKAAAEKEAAKIVAEEETKRKQIEADNAIKLEQEKAKLEQQAKDAELARQKKEAQEAKNNKPNVKYNNLLNAVKQDINSAKTYTTKAFNLLGITKTNDSQTNGSAIFFPPQIITVSAISGSNDAKTRSLINSSRYKSDQNFVCTKNTKENFIKNELNNVYNTIKKSRDNLSNGIAEIEATNADDEATSTISESKINTLYLTQNKLTEIMETVEGYTSNLKTSCETRCEGMSSMSNMTSSISSSPIQFDENGNIIEEKKKTDENAYSCKDLENTTSSSTNSFVSSISGSSSMADMFGGIGKKVTELTKRATESVLYTDRILDEALIAVQSGKFDGFSSGDYPAIDDCIQYMVLDIASYTECVSRTLGQQLLALSKNKTNSTIISELNSSIKTTITNIKSPNYKLEKEELYCTTGGKEAKTVKDISYSNLNNFEDFNNCILSITNALNSAKKQKEKTGDSNWLVTGASGDYVSTTQGTFEATAFAKEKLKWTEVKDNSCKLYISQNTSTNYGYMGSTSINTGIDLNSSGITCTCKDGSASESFSNINNNIGLEKCGRTKDIK